MNRHATAPLTVDAAAPREAADRVKEIDALRGLALSGVLIVNALLMAGPGTVFGAGPSSGPADRATAWLVGAFVAGKFYPLFAFLFGYSFVQQQRAAQRDDAAFAPRHLRRTTALFIVGALHAVLLFPGDILTAYAVLALPLFAFRHTSARTAVRVGLVIVGILSLMLLTLGLVAVATTTSESGAGGEAVTGATVSAYRGGFSSVVTAHLHALPGTVATNLLYAPQMFAAFLFGLAVAGSETLKRSAGDRERLRGMVRHCLPLGMVGGIATAMCTHGPLERSWFFVGQAVGVLIGPVLTAGYVGCALLLFSGSGGERAADILAAAGRLSLTHYLTQSFVLCFVFTGVGLGWYDRVGATQVVVGCVLLFAGQLAVSRPLTAKGRRGPAEAVLRWVTRGAGRSQPAPSAGRFTY
ncbi:DUF418 domain-containing protein [Streptomyces sp. NPDC090106]|uniref:DUF418 domain-containing protein n=1 Tax=Streptomyces sp. NPDC090106 TaxID=3365946 RepID=UPI0037F4D4B5